VGIEQDEPAGDGALGVGIGAGGGLGNERLRDRRERLADADCHARLLADLAGGRRSEARPARRFRRA